MDDSHELTDAALCDEVRRGEAWPLGVLWSRHHGVALGWALKKDSSLGEDVVAESFDLVFQALLRGGGPTDAFRPYLFRTMNAQFGTHWKSRQRSAEWSDVEFTDPDSVGVDARFEADEQRDAASVALRELPERWQQVIIAVDVEGRSVQEVADNFGLTPNAASVLLKRAREGLRKTWLTVMHPARDLPDDCASSVSRFGELRWGKKHSEARLAAQAHTDSCDDCSARWLQFKDQAVLVGLVSAGVLALGTGAHRRITVPAAATVGVAALALTATGLIAPLFGADLFPTPSDTAANVEEQSAAAPREATPTPDAATNVAADGPLAAPAGRPQPPSDAVASASGQADGTGVRGADGSADTRASGTSQSDGSASSNPGSRAAANSSADPASSNVLYFGDWSDWCESSQSFTPTC